MISIFAKPSFLNINPSQSFKDRVSPPRGQLMRVSSTIRGDQIADQIGAKLNPTSGYENDVCIYIKPMVRKGEDFKFEGRRAYIDIIDGHNLGGLVAKYPDVGAIVCSRADLDVAQRRVGLSVHLCWSGTSRHSSINPARHCTRHAYVTQRRIDAA